MECDIRSMSELSDNAQKNAPTPPGLTVDIIFCIIDGTKTTDSVSETLRNKTSHKELRSFIYEKNSTKNPCI